MTSPRDKFSAAIRRVIDAIESLSDEEFARLTDSSYGIEIRLTRKRTKEDVAPSLSEEALQSLIAKLTGFASRDDAQQFLEANFGTRKSVEPIARSLDIPILKQDKVEVLRDKVIEATVGARIRSQAIQGAKG